MSLQGTFNTAVQAMNSQSQFLSNISTNIANVNTTAYKAQDTHFATLLNHTTPPDKSFFTVNTFDFRNVDKQGTVTTTQRTFDLALNGRGFMVTNTAQDGSGTWQYTRDGAMFGKAVQLTTDTNGDGIKDQGTLLTTADGTYVYGWKADSDGKFSTQANSLSSLTPIMYNSESSIDATPTTSIQFQGNVSVSSSGRQVVGLPFVDQNGNSRTLTLGLTARTDGTPGFTVDMSSIGTDNQPVTVAFDPPTIGFNGQGNINDPSDSKISILVEDPSGPQAISLDLTHLTQLGEQGNITVQNIEQNGFLKGTLNNTYFTQDGILVGSYSNGEVKNLYKLPVATFDADNNLDAKSGNTFVQTAEAGTLNLRGLDTPNGTTHFVVGALEQSTVDLADQFSKMIITQRAYSSAATVLRTADEMTQAARDLKR